MDKTIKKTGAFKGTKIYVTGTFAVVGETFILSDRFRMRQIPGKKFLRKLAGWAARYQEAHDAPSNACLGEVLTKASVLPNDDLEVTLKITVIHRNGAPKDVLTNGDLPALLDNLSAMYDWDVLDSINRSIEKYQKTRPATDTGNIVLLSHEETGKFLVALGRTMLQGVSFEDLIEHPTKAAVQTLFEAMRSEGVDAQNCDSLFERGCGEVFKRWP